MYRRVGRGAQTPGRRMAGGGLGGAGGGKGVAGEEEGSRVLLAPRPSSSLSSSTKEKRKRRERMSANDDDNSGRGDSSGDVFVGIGVGVVPPERRPWHHPLFLLLPGRAGRRGRGGGLETAAMRTPAAVRITAKPRVGGSDDGLR